MPQLHIEVSLDLKEALQVWAEAHDRSIASAVRVAIKQLTEQDTSQPQEIQRRQSWDS